MTKHFQSQRFLTIKYNGRNVLPSVNIEHARVQKQRLQHPTTLSDGFVYYPLDITTPHIEAFSKTTKFDESRIPKTFIVTLRTETVENESDFFFGKTREDIRNIVSAVLEEINHRVCVDFCKRVDDDDKKFIRDTNQLQDKLKCGCRAVVRILCESEHWAVLARVALHQAKSNELNWTATLSEHIKRIVYAKVSVWSIIGYLFCGIRDSEASDSNLNRIIAIIHGDAIGHHPKTTMITLKFMSLDGKKVFRGKKRVSEVVPAIIAVGDDTQSRPYFRQVLNELIKVVDSGYFKVSGGARLEKKFLFGMSRRFIAIVDRLLSPLVTGCTPPSCQSAIVYSVCCEWSNNIFFYPCVRCFCFCFCDFFYRQ